MKLFAILFAAAALFAQEAKPPVAPKPELPKTITVPEAVVVEYFRQAAIAAQAQLAQRDIRDQMVEFCRKSNGGEVRASQDQQGHQVFECQPPKKESK